MLNHAHKYLLAEHPLLQADLSGVTIVTGCVYLVILLY